MIDQALAALVSDGLEVPLATGGSARYVNLDNAASTSPLRSVADAVTTALPWYASVHRGAGFASQVSTRLYEAARAQVGAFVGARDTDSVVFVRNTTEGLNLLAYTLDIGADDVIITTAVEHHANLLPWRRRGRVVHLAVPESPDALLASLDEALATASGRVAVVAVTGASNVTGEIFPIAEIAKRAHAAGAIVVVDAAQLAPHRGIDMATLGVDCLALSGHKLHAPFGAGAVVAPKALLSDCEPMLAGGGAIDLVTLESVLWTAPPDRHEAGSPNVLGAVALGAAAEALSGIGMEQVAAHEMRLLAQLDDAARGISGLRRLVLWDGPEIDRVGVFTFVVEGMHHAQVAAALSAEWGIGVRHGCFCAHPYIVELLGLAPAEVERLRHGVAAGEHPNMPGAVRASFSVGTTGAEVERLVLALETLCAHGPQLSYRRDEFTGDYGLEDDPRAWPQLSGLPDLSAPGEWGAACGRL